MNPLVSRLPTLTQLQEAQFSGCGQKFFVFEETRRDATNGTEAPCAVVGVLYILDSTYHHHGGTSELYVMLDGGEGGSKFIIDGEYVDITPGQIILLPPGVAHGGAGNLQALMHFTPGLAKRKETKDGVEISYMAQRDEAVLNNSVKAQLQSAVGRNDSTEITPGGAIIAQIPAQYLGDPSPHPTEDEPTFSRRIPDIAIEVRTVRSPESAMRAEAPGTTKIHTVLGGTGEIKFPDRVLVLDQGMTVLIPEGVKSALNPHQGQPVNVLTSYLFEDQRANRIDLLSTQVLKQVQVSIYPSSTLKRIILDS